MKLHKTTKKKQKLKTRRREKHHDKSTPGIVTTSWKASEVVAGFKTVTGDDIEPEAEEHSDEEVDIDGRCRAILGSFSSPRLSKLHPSTLERPPHQVQYHR